MSPEADDRARRRFEDLFAANRRAVLGYALRRVAEPADAADVVAETFLTAWRRIGEVPGGDASRLWLFGVARRVVANQRRGDLRRDRLADRLRAEVRTAVPVPPPGGIGADVAAALSRLPDDDREILALHAWEGLAPAEIATVLALPAATTRTRLHRARTRMRAELAALGITTNTTAPAAPPATSGQATREER